MLHTTICGVPASLHTVSDLIFDVCLITFSCTLLLLSLLSDRQVKRMYILTRFIDYHYKSILSIIRAKHVLTLHLSTAN